MRKRYGVILVAVALAGAASVSAREAAPRQATPAALGPSARMDDVVKRDAAGDVKAKGLTARERRAIDIVRVEATGDTFGAIVTVTFAGSFEAAVGRGKLAKAVAGIVLRPRSGRPTVVGTRGPGVRGDDGGGLGGRGPFVVVRQGRKLTFIALNVDFTKIARLQAKTFSALPSPRRTTQSSSFDPEFYTLIASRTGEDFWEAENREVDDEEHCRNLREQLKEEEARRSELVRKVNRARAEGRRINAAKLGQDLQRVDRLVRDLERQVAECNAPPPAPDFGCRSEAQNHPQLADHDVIAFGLCQRTVDRVEMTTSAPFRRTDTQGVVVNTSTRTFRFVPIMASSDRAFAVTIQPPMQQAEGLQLAVQGLPAGTRIEIVPYGEEIRGQLSTVTTP